MGVPVRGKGMEHARADFAEFYADSRDDCLRAVVAGVGDRAAAQDLTDEAFARAWASWGKLRRHPAPRAWVVRTAFNLSVSVWRKRRREFLTADLPPGAGVTSAGTAGEAVEADLITILRRLPLRQRQVVALRIFLDLDTARTAEVLGIAPGTVTAHLTRALATLREDVRLCYPEDR
jgi:RNA polymerase sigma-70 factor (sigma-E family)